MKSDSIASLAAAMAKAQGEIEGAAKDATNPHFRSSYATLASVWNACREALSRNGIAVFQAPATEGPVVSVTTTLAHASGEWIDATMSTTARDSAPQSIGSALSYLRRYGLAAMVGVAPEDDDGEAAQPQARRQPRAVDTRPENRLDAPPRSTFTEKVEMSKQVFAGAREVDFPTEGEPDTATSEKLSGILNRIYPGNDEDSQKLKSEWLCRQLGVNKVPKGKTARAIFDLRPLDDRVRIIAAAEAYEEQSRPAGWMSGAAPMETAVTKEGEK